MTILLLVHFGLTPHLPPTSDVLYGCSLGVTVKGNELDTLYNNDVMNTNVPQSPRAPVNSWIFCEILR